jgi:hypothetical protein
MARLIYFIAFNLQMFLNLFLKILAATPGFGSTFGQSTPSAGGGLFGQSAAGTSTGTGLFGGSGGSAFGTQSTGFSKRAFNVIMFKVKSI